MLITANLLLIFFASLITFKRRNWYSNTFLPRKLTFAEAIQWFNIINYRVSHPPLVSPPLWQQTLQKPFPWIASVGPVSRSLCCVAQLGSLSYCEDVIYSIPAIVFGFFVCLVWLWKLTFSAGGLVESACPGPPLLANLGPRLLCRPLDNSLVSLLEVDKVTAESVFAHIQTTNNS